MAIRYDKKINQEINRTIKNFNQKIARLEKTERELILPEKITKSKLKENVYTRTELRRKLRQLQRYSTRGIEETIKTKGGVELSKYELINLKKETARVKSNLTREINKMKITSPKILGKETARTFAQMGDSHFLNLQARRSALEKGDITLLTMEQLKQYKQLVSKSAMNKIYYNNVFKDNYMKMLTDLGYYYGYDKEKLDYLKSKINEIEGNNFYKLFTDEKAIKAITDYYPAVVSGSITGLNPDDVKEDITNLYDNLIDNLDDILNDYKNQNNTITNNNHNNKINLEINYFPLK